MTSLLSYIGTPRTMLSLLLVLFVSWQWGNAARIHGKARLAQILIAHAWQQAIAHPERPLSALKPWSWADTWPVARFQWQSDAAESPEADLWVLAGANGSSLAFGPGHMAGTAMPGEGAMVIAGHRDTHFAFLASVQDGDQLRLQTRRGDWLSYVVKEIQVVNSESQMLTVDPTEDSLWLITCYPFNAINPGGPLRYLVKAVRDVR
jgi:sortase A